MGKVLGTPSRESTASRVGPRLWRKHALPFTSFIHPKDPSRIVKITREFAERLKANFDAGVRDIVPVPAKGAGGHSDDWRDSKGNTVGLEVHPDKGVYVTVQVDEEADAAIAEGKLAGVSLSFDEDWYDPVAAKRVGPVLRHTALTNVPYIKGTEPFVPVDLAEDDEFIQLAEAPPADPPQEDPVDLEKLKAELLKHGIDVAALEERASKFDEAQKKADTVASLRKALVGAGVELSEDASDDDLIEAVSGLKAKADEATSLSERVGVLEQKIEDDAKATKRREAERMVAPYLAKGLVAEADKDRFISLAETTPDIAETALKALSGNVLLTELSVSGGHEDPPGEIRDREFDGVADLSEEERAEVERLTGAGKT